MECLVSVNGTDFQIKEPFPFCKKTSKVWYSEKLNAAAVRYEVALSIYNGNIVWVNGPFPAGAFTDVKIFLEEGLADSLDEG